MENIDLGKSANQLWKESGSTLSFKNWLQREKDKGRFLPNKKLMEFNSVDGDSNVKSSQELIQETLNKNKSNAVPKNITYGLSKAVILISATLILGAVAYKIYQKKTK
jgi:hypothetical protein